MASQHLRSNFDPISGIAAYVSLPQDKPALSARQVSAEPLFGQFKCRKCGGAYPLYYLENGVCTDCFSSRSGEARCGHKD